MATFHVDRPTDHRAPKPWHRLAYIGGELPRVLHSLVPELRLERGQRVLDFGCAEAPYREAFTAAGVDYLGADLPGNRDADLVLHDDGTLPLEADSVDGLLSTQVLEHVADPRIYLGECFRVLRPGRRMLLSTHGIMVYHPDPDDYWRWTCAGLRREVSRAGFEVVSLQGVMGLAATGIQLFQDSVLYRLPRFVRPLFSLIAQSCARLADRLEPRSSKDLNALVFFVVAERPR